MVDDALPKWHRVALVGTGAALATVVAVLLARRGAIATPDSIVYTGVAQSLLDGDGLTIPFVPYTDRIGVADALATDGRVSLRQWPPVYPIVLALLARVSGAVPTSVAAVLNPILLSVNVALLAVLTARLFVARWAALFTALLVVVIVRDASLSAASVTFLHASMLSEPLLLCLVLSSLVFLDRVLVSRAPIDLWTAALLAAMATGTRLVGVSLAVLVAGVAIWRGPTRHRAAHAVLATSVVLLPAVLVSAGADGGREGPLGERLRESLGSFAVGLREAVIPLGTAPAFSWLVLGGLIVATGLALVHVRRDGATALELARWLAPGALGTLMLAHLVVTRALIDPYVVLVGRQMTVPAVLLLVSFFSVWSAWGRERTATTALMMPVGLTVVTVLLGAPALAAAVREPIEPADLTDVIAAVGEIPPQQSIVSNAPDVVYVASGRSSAMVPCPIDYYSGAPDPDHGRDVQALEQALSEGAVFVWFGGTFGRAAECLSPDALGPGPWQRTQVGERVVVVGLPDE